MSIQSEIKRIEGLRDDLRIKLIEMGCVTEENANLETCVSAVDGISVNTAESKTLDTSTTAYTIPEGYHNGSGKVSITTETKNVTPATSSQTIVPSTGKVLSQVTVSAIPSQYKDVSPVTATGDQVLEGETIVTADGVVEGAMPDKSGYSYSLDALTSMSVTIPEGYHDGSGTVSIASTVEDALAAI